MSTFGTFNPQEHVGDRHLQGEAGPSPGKSNLMQEVVKFGNFCDEFSEGVQTDTNPKGNEFGECVLRPGECRSSSTGTAGAANFHGMYSECTITRWRGVHL